MTAILDDFGVSKFEPIRETNTSFLLSLTPLVDDSAFAELKKICQNVLRGDTYSVSNFHLRNMLFRMMNTDPNRTHETIMQVIVDEVLRFSVQFQAYLTQKTLTAELFIQEYKAYNQRIMKLVHVMEYYEDKTKRQSNDGKRRSQIQLMSNRTFVEHFVGHKYRNGDQEEYPFLIMEKLLRDSKDVNLETITMLDKIFGFFQRLCRVPNKPEDPVLKSVLGQKFLVTMGANEKFVLNMISQLNTFLHNYSANPSEVTKKQVEDILNIAMTFDDRQIFTNYYVRTLEDRLKGFLKEESKLDPKFESHLVSKFRSPQDNYYIFRMLRKIKDVELSKSHNEMFQQLEVKKDSAKYQSIPSEVIEAGRKKWRFLVQYHGAWETSQDKNPIKYNLPLELSVYLDTFNAYHAIRYKHKDINYNMNASEADITVVLGGTSYKFRVNIPQMLVLYHLGNKGQLTAKEIAELMGVELPRLNLTVTGLMMAKVIAREGESKTNPDMKLYLNEEFKKEETYIDLVEWEKLVDKMMKKKAMAQPSANGTQLVKIKMEFIKIMQNKSSITKKDLLSELKKIVDFEPTEEMLNIVLQKCHAENLFVVEGETISKKEKKAPTKKKSGSDSSDSDAELVADN